jgi:hypothetical protein
MDSSQPSQSQSSDEITLAIDNIVPVPNIPQIPADAGATSENTNDPYKDNDLRRHDKLKGVFHWVVVWGIRIAFGIFLIVFLIRVSHLVLPSYCRWLTNDDIQGIDKLFFSGTIGGVIGRYIKVVIPNK